MISQKNFLNYFAGHASQMLNLVIHNKQHAVNSLRF